MGKIIERVRDRSKADKAEGCVVMGLTVRQVGAVCSALGNTVIAQYLAQCSQVTLLEEMQAERRRAA